MNKNKPKNGPPKWPLRFFQWYCHPGFVEDIEGDLHERFAQKVEEHGLKKARRNFALEVLWLFRPGIIRSINTFSSPIDPDMLRQNIKIGFRNLLKHKGYSFIKISGFALGIASFILILLYVQDELRYDQHYTQKDRVYRLLNTTTYPESQFKKWTSFSAQAKQLLNEDYPEIEVAGRIIVQEWYLAGANQIRRSDQKQNYYEKGFVYADPELIDILEIPLIYGNPQEALAKPQTILLSYEKAEKYFPNENPVGKTIVLNDDVENSYTIGGVMDKLSPTHLNFDFILTLEGVEFWNGEQTDWCCQNYDLYLRVLPGADIPELEKKLLSIKDDYILRYLLEREDQFADVILKHRAFELQPIGDIYLKSIGTFDNHDHGDIRMVRLFGAIAIFILLLACINFINLFTAKSANRAREVGVRKVAGSYRGDLIRQFLTESTLYSGISVALGAILAFTSLPFFSNLVGKNLSLPVFEWWFVPGLVGLSLFMGLLAGIYPSFYLSSFQPVKVLKGNLSMGSKNSRLRDVMVVFQFTISVILIVCALVVYYQIRYILNKDVGFDKQRMVMIHGAGMLRDKTDEFKAELERLPLIEGVTNSNYFPVDGTSRDNNAFWVDGRQKLDKSTGAQAWWVAQNYIPTMKINLLKGRNFSKEMAGDTAATIINKLMAERLGLKEPIGKHIRNWRTWEVVGVVDNFHFENMKQDIRPIAMFMGRGGASIVAARVKNDQLGEAVNSIKGVWDKFLPNQSIRYTLLDESFANMYVQESQTGKIAFICAALAILIACLGLFGLSTFMAEQRNKEINIRKVLGASVVNLYQLLTFNYLKLILIAMVIGTPIAWYLMHKWLENYSYHMDLKWWYFVLAGILVSVIALMTVSQQAIKLTFTNPAEVLKGD